jgi:stress-induced morphogen
MASLDTIRSALQEYALPPLPPSHSPSLRLTLLKFTARRELNPSFLYVHDDSEGCGQMLTIVVAAQSFDGVGVLDRQRRVHGIAAVAAEIAKAHAVSLKTWTPAQLEERKGSLSDAARAALAASAVSE